ncbi:hypothetical protein ACFL9T_20910 [Thermodesulfobacteriota bacterium]
MEPLSSAIEGVFVPSKMGSSGTNLKAESQFQRVLLKESLPGTEQSGIVAVAGLQADAIAPAPLQAQASTKQAAAAYQKQENIAANPKGASALQKYKDDQLLSNPGGDHYYLKQGKVITDPEDQKSFWGRVGKDLSDAFGNVKNFFQNLFFGSKIHYRDQENQIQEASQRGLVGSVGDFFMDLGSAFSFGLWRPDGEAEPQGFAKRCGFFFSKMKEALFGDLIQGVSGSIVHMGEDLLLAGWNLLETIPDATIGNFKAGKKATTAVFDNGQVVLDYLTDIIPSGDAWVRVHSPDLKEPKAPIWNNISRPESSNGDSRWKYVRNTPFRKTIETVGSLFMDVVTLWLLGQVRLFGEKRD